ncbi:MAG: hypothetical protein FJY92_05015 [Candidatus Hydrogenedentes bacterium]|nr:hypothetical protein [Candidatus Hydrogenedentota bacterium]
MIELHPQIVTKDGKPESVVLPYEEFIQVREVLRQIEGGLSFADPRYGGYWDNLSADELAARQGVQAIERIEDLYGDGDPTDWDGFDEALERLRVENPVV